MRSRRRGEGRGRGQVDGRRNSGIQDPPIKSGTRSYQFVLANRGEARAEEVTFEFIESDAGELPGLIMEGHRFPISLDAGQEYAVGAFMVMGTAQAVDVTLRWTDGTSPREKALNLTVFG